MAKSYIFAFPHCHYEMCFLVPLTFICSYVDINIWFCYHRICTCAKPSTRSQILCNYGRIYHYHLSRYFPCFSVGERSTTREAFLVTSRDQIARLAKPTTPYLGPLMVSFCALVPSCHRIGKRGTLLGGPHKGNVLLPTILNPFHPGTCHNVLNFGNGSWFIFS
jgi:hypothetical protein